MDARIGDQMPDPKPYRPPYQFSVTIGETCNRKMRNFVDLAEKLRMPVEDLMRQCNGHAPPSRALVKGLARELDINDSYLEKLADEVRKDLGVGAYSKPCGPQSLRKATPSSKRVENQPVNRFCPTSIWSRLTVY